MTYNVFGGTLNLAQFNSILKYLRQDECCSTIQKNFITGNCLMSRLSFASAVSA